MMRKRRRETKRCMVVRLPTCCTAGKPSTLCHLARLYGRSDSVSAVGSDIWVCSSRPGAEPDTVEEQSKRGVNCTIV